MSVLNVLNPPWSPRAMKVLTEYRAKVRSGEIPNPTLNVRVNAMEIAQRSQSAWVIACHVRAAIDGKKGRDVGKFDLNDYVENADLGAKGRKKPDADTGVHGETRRRAR